MVSETVIKRLSLMSQFECVCVYCVPLGGGGGMVLGLWW
jgi:hypothetical protein